MPPPAFTYKYRIYNKNQAGDSPLPSFDANSLSSEGGMPSSRNYNHNHLNHHHHQQQQQRHHRQHHQRHHNTDVYDTRRLNRSFDLGEGFRHLDDDFDFSPARNVRGGAVDGFGNFPAGASSSINISGLGNGNDDSYVINNTTTNDSSIYGHRLIPRHQHLPRSRSLNRNMDASFSDQQEFKTYSFRTHAGQKNSAAAASSAGNNNYSKLSRSEIHLTNGDGGGGGGGGGQTRRGRSTTRGPSHLHTSKSAMSLDRRDLGPHYRSFSKAMPVSFADGLNDDTDNTYDHPPPYCGQHESGRSFRRSLSNEAINKNQSSMRSVGLSSQTPSTMSSTMRDMLNRSQEQVPVDGVLSLDVIYITERIISMTFPSEGHDTTYSFNLMEVVRMLKTKHGDNYMILNLSEKRQDLSKANPQVKDYGWPDHMAPPLERLCSLCKAMDSWLNADVRNVVVLHCKGGRSRIASVIAAFMHYSNICASADQALDRFAMKRFYDDKLGGLPLPSQRRYVRYFSGLLSGAIKINSNPLYLHHILIHGVPNFDTRGGCRPFIKVYQGMQPIFTSGVYNVTDNMQKVCISISPGIPLRGDILIKCYHKKTRSGGREVIWQCQFHTCAISDDSLVFSKQELDDAIMDPRFPDNGKVEFVFGPSSDILVSVSGFKSDVTVPVDDNEESLARSDSYENFQRNLEAIEVDVNRNGIPSTSKSTASSSSAQQSSSSHHQTRIINNHYQQQHHQPQIHHNQNQQQLYHHEQIQQQQQQPQQQNYGRSPVPVDHNRAPDGSLYATVNKRVPPPPPYSSAVGQQQQHPQHPPQPLPGLDPSTGAPLRSHNKPYTPHPSHLTNGSHTSSLDSGYAGHNTSFTSHHTSSATSHNNVNINNNNIVKSPTSETTNHHHHHIHSPTSPTTSSSSPLAAPIPKSPRQQTAEERSQLDDLLSDLLSEQAYVSPSQVSPQSFTTAAQSSQHSPIIIPIQQQQQQQQLSPRDPNSSIASSGSSGGGGASNSMNNAKTITTTTRTYTNYTSTDSVPNPDRVLIQRAEVTYKLPGQAEVKDHYTIAADPNQAMEAPQNRSHQYAPKSPQNAFSYTSGMTSQSTTSSQRTQQQQRAEVVEHEVVRVPVKQVQSPPPTARLPYRPDYSDSNITNGTNNHSTTSSSNQQYQYSSLDGEANAWLAQQQQKLKNFKEGRDSSGRTEAEKKLVNELRFAQNKYYTRRTNSEDEERAMMDAYNRNALTTSHNGPVSSEHVAPSYTPHHQRSHSTTAVDNWPNDQQQQYSYQTSSSSFVESRSYGGDTKRSNKPPPSPTMQRSIVAMPIQSTPSAAPAPVPARSSSKEYMRTRSNSSSTWQQQNQQQQHISRPLQRQASDIIYDRNRDVEHVIPKSYGSTRSTPPPNLAPRTPSPVGPTSTTTYTQYRTLNREQRAPQPPPPQPQPPPPPQQVNHHYITEVYVHRQDKDKTDSTRLEELEKNLERAQQSIIQQHQRQPVQAPTEVAEEMVRTHTDSRQFQKFAESPQKPEPLRVKEIEEDRIILRPIGPGVQTLEPESAHTGTLGRPTTPGFPSAPATPPFPVSPKVPHHQSVGTLQPQQQHQTIQYQQQYHQTQQYQTHQTQNGPPGGQGTLHIDTSPKMLSARSPSASSPPSPGNINTLRQQLNSAHSMSNSVVSPGPHSATGQSSPSVYFGLSRRGSLSSLADSDMVHTTPKFVKDTSKYWYKPHISREDAIQMLKDKQPGTFVIRDSNSFPGAFGLALKVASIPANVQAKPSGDPQADLVRHFLIEPTPKGVRLRGCSNEPVFGSLASMVYQHSVTPLALPCKLTLPEADIVDGVAYPESPMNTPDLNSAAILLAQGAACNVVFINSVDMESLTGPQAVAKAIKTIFDMPPPPPAQGKRTTVVHFKVSGQGITLTDNNRKLFFRRHYPVPAVTFCGMDPQDRRWKRDGDMPGGQGDARMFGFVARKQNSTTENSCHIFCELDPEQPASAIVNFVTKVMIGPTSAKS